MQLRQRSEVETVRSERAVQRMTITRLIQLILAAVCLVSAADAGTYPVRLTSGGQLQGGGSAVCVGARESDAGTVYVFLTNRHVVETGREIWVGDDRDWHRGERVQVSGRHDLATFVVAGGRWHESKLITGVPVGTRVSVCGYGHSARNRFCFRGRLTADGIEAGGLTSAPGDSGGAVMVDDCDGGSGVAGVHWGYLTNERRTMFVSTADCCRFLSGVYGSPPRCTPYSCRPPTEKYERVIPQPLGLGPPRVERYERPIVQQPRPVEPQQPPREQPQQRPPPVLEISRQQLQESITPVVQHWLEQNRDQLRGPAGRDGQDGRDSGAGQWQSIAARLSAVEQQRRRVVLMESGQIIDDETYGPDDAIVLDLKRFNRSQ